MTEPVVVPWQKAGGAQLVPSAHVGAGADGGGQRGVVGLTHKHVPSPSS